LGIRKRHQLANKMIQPAIVAWHASQQNTGWCRLAEQEFLEIHGSVLKQRSFPSNPLYRL